MRDAAKPFSVFLMPVAEGRSARVCEALPLQRVATIFSKRGSKPVFGELRGPSESPPFKTKSAGK